FAPLWTSADSRLRPCVGRNPCLALAAPEERHGEFRYSRTTNQASNLGATYSHSIPTAFRTSTLQYRLRPSLGRNPSRRSSGGRRVSGSSKVNSSPGISFQ